jgi:nitrous oxidase accessory protein NosD
METTRIASLLPRLAILLLLFAGVFAPAPARADTTDCTTISAVPVKISSPGHYCLTANLVVTSGTCCAAPAIQVAANDVMLDCNGFSVSNPNTTDARNGLLSTTNDVTVRNCTFNDFSRGILVQAGKRVRLENNAVVRARVLGISTNGASVFVLDGHVIDTAGCQGIYAQSTLKSVTTIAGNVIRGVACPAGTPTGIVVAGGGRTVVRDNKLEGLGTAGVSTQSFGVLISHAASVLVPSLVSDNHFYLMNSTSHVAVIKTSTAQKARCSGNLSPGYASPHTGCL